MRKSKKKENCKMTAFGYKRIDEDRPIGNSGYQPTATTPAAPPTHGSNIRRPDMNTDGWLGAVNVPTRIKVGDVVNPIGTDFVAKVVEVGETGMVKILRFLPSSEPLFYYESQLRVLK